ncbi:MAG TPA: TonB-dependent receptor [Candidatus Didemnitutus sp.]|nr:TonB-dependent receptor [Candidatus Didemnitutus sp.]
MKRAWCILALSSFAGLRLAGQTVVLPSVFVTADRSDEAPDSVAFAHEVVAGDDLRSTPAVSVDGALRGIPGFSLFRRTDSLVANPTTQGVSLRGLGPSGASRSLILLDGVPLNDPFGGWIYWSLVPRESLAAVELVPGGGSTAWGNGALGGVVQLLTEPASGQRFRLMAETGGLDTRAVEIQASQPVGPGTLQILARDFSTAGYSIVAPSQRGSIDIPATSRSHWATVRWSQPVGADATVTLTARTFNESRGNGTPYTNNATRQNFASVDLQVRPSAAFHWEATGYIENEGFSSTFSSVNATRTAETPSNNQFAVPDTAEGFSWIGEWRPDANQRTSFGLDVRDTRGETREDSSYVNGVFTRRRFAGGRQSDGGIFVLHSRDLASGVRVTAGLRADDWVDFDGHRRDLGSGVEIDDFRYPSQNGIEMSPSAGVVWSVRPDLRLHVSAQESFRRPTLNELYRPFRVGNVITDANPALQTEKNLGGEIGADWTAGKLTLQAAAFANQLRDPVANVTIAKGPANVPGIGVVPAGGEARRRLNLDEVRVQGLFLSARWELAPTLSAEAQYLLDDTDVRRASVAPWLVGLQLAEVPRNAATIGLDWRPDRHFHVTPRLRWVGQQFDDDLNTLRLAPSTLLDLSVEWEITAGWRIFVSGENLTNRLVQTGRTTDGLVNVGTPRLVMFGVRWSR